MRKLILVLLCLTFIQGCSINGDELVIPEENVSEINLPKESEVYGKAVADEIRTIVDNLNNKGYSFSETKNKAEIEQFYEEVYGASSVPRLKSNKPSSFNFDPVAIQRAQDELTESQRKVVSQIVNAYGERKTDDDFKRRLISINNNVYKNVPKIEQERLFNIISVVYYSLAQIRLLELNGAIVRQNQNSLSKSNIPRLKSSSEEGSGGDSETCREEQSAFAIAIGYINSIGEKVTKVTQAAAGAMGAFIITWCMSRELGNIERCSEIFSSCQSPGNHPSWVNSQPGTGMSKCGECLLECQRSNGQWKCSTDFRNPYR